MHPCYTISTLQSQFRGVALELPYPILGLLPGLAWLLYFYWKGRDRDRSFRNVCRVFLAGCICTFPTGLVEHITGAGLMHQETVLQSAKVSFLLIAPIEEFFKLLAVWVTIYRRQDFREPLDGIVYASSAALGFASIENAIYLLQMGPSIFVQRTIYATPAHVLFSSMWGYSLAIARFRREGEIRIIAQGFVAAALFHGAYNFLITLSPKAAEISLLPLMLFMGGVMTWRLREFRRRFPFPLLGEEALILCLNCGAYILEHSEECSRCGVPVGPPEQDDPRFCGRCRARIGPDRARCGNCGANLASSHSYFSDPLL